MTNIYETNIDNAKGSPNSYKNTVVLDHARLFA